MIRLDTKIVSSTKRERERGYGSARRRVTFYVFLLALGLVFGAVAAVAWRLP